MTPLVTVIIPTYRRPTLLRRAMRSVVRQTLGDVKICVYDNASDDETPEVVAEFAARDSRIEYHRQPRNIGAFDNFLFGMQRVETEFFSFLSDDDIVLPAFLAGATAALAREPDAMMFAGSTLELGQDGTLRYAPVLRWPREGRFDPPDGAWHMLANKHPTWTSVLFRRAVIDRIGLLDKEVGAPSDLDYELNVAAHFPIVISYRACAAFVRHPQAFSNHETASVIAGYRRMADKLGADSTLVPSVRAGLARALQRQARLKLIEIGVKSVVRADDASAREALAELRRDGVKPLSVAARLVLPICMNVPPARAALRAAESIRVRLRAVRAGQLAARRSDSGSLPADLPAWLRQLDA